MRFGALGRIRYGGPGTAGGPTGAGAFRTVYERVRPPRSLSATAVMAPVAIASAGSEAQQSRWLPELAGGSVIAGAAFTEVIGARLDAGLRCDGGRLSGKALFVLDFEADVYLVADENRALYLVEANASGLERQLLTTVDRTRRVGELVLDNVSAELLPGSSDPDRSNRVRQQWGQQRGALCLRHQRGSFAADDRVGISHQRPQGLFRHRLPRPLHQVERRGAGDARLCGIRRQT